MRDLRFCLAVASIGLAFCAMVATLSDDGPADRGASPVRVVLRLGR
jgi:hypothetical protein